MKIIIEWVNILVLIYIVLLIVVIIIIMIFYLLGKVIFKEVIDKLLEFGKWYMVVVVIVFFGKLLDLSFIDREISIKEIVIYEKYVINIMEIDSIEKRWKFIEYFVVVILFEKLRE